MNPNATISPVTTLPSDPQVRSSAWLGRIIEAGETWAILADGEIMDVCPSAETAVAWLAGRIGMDDAGTRRFMELNGWKLVRVQTSYKVMAVLETQYQMRPNNQAHRSAQTADGERKGKHE